MQMTALAPLFNMLPTPIIVLQDTQPYLNHRIVFMNQRFVDMTGWTSEDSPDKDTWWENAYPVYGLSKSGSATVGTGNGQCHRNG